MSTACQFLQTEREIGSLRGFGEKKGIFLKVLLPGHWLGPECRGSTSGFQGAAGDRIGKAVLLVYVLREEALHLDPQPR